MHSNPDDALWEAIRKTLQNVPADVRAIRESLLAAQRCESSELLLAELRIQRERLKRLIRALTEEAEADEGGAQSSPCASRHRCCGHAECQPAAPDCGITEEPEPRGPRPPKSR